MRRAPHRLYGFLDAAERGSVGLWRERPSPRSRPHGRKAGCRFWSAATGLYLRALQRGLAPVPAIPAAIRAEAAALYDALGGAGFRERLAAARSGGREPAARR